MKVNDDNFVSETAKDLQLNLGEKSSIKNLEAHLQKEP